MREAGTAIEAGKAARERLPLAAVGDFKPGTDRSDPIELLERQGQTRVWDLLPIRYGRMLLSPFSFYRGAAAVMSSDLARSDDSGLRVQLCGDAHVANFGGFASAERALVFDINDFDETVPGPWEWDLKRLVASLEIAGRQNGFSTAKRERIVRAAAGAYRSAMRDFARLPFLEVWYQQLNVRGILSRWRSSLDARSGRRLATAHRRGKDNQRAIERLTHTVDNELRFVSTPPLVQRLDDLMPADEAAMFKRETNGYLDAYRASLSNDRRAVLDRFIVGDIARKVVGIGSVGTRTNIALLLGQAPNEHLVLQIKEAQRSVLEPFAGRSEYEHSGRRVVEGQRLMQASADILLGWARGPGIDGVVRDYYIRQMWDSKISPDIDRMSSRVLRTMGKACAWTLARAHARSGDRVAISTYLGKGRAFADAISRFAVAYADQNERDYKALVAAVDQGRIVARRGV